MPLRCTCSCILALVLAHSLPALGLTPGDGVEACSAGKGCIQDGPSGYFLLSEDDGEGTILYEVVYLVDEDSNGQYEAWCEGTTTPVTFWTTGSSPVTTCAGGIATTLTALSHGCAFDIDLWVGSSESDKAGVGSPVDCSGNDDPVVMLGLAGDDLLRGSQYGDALLGGLGNDQLDGDDGKDHLCGASGEELIQGGVIHEPVGKRELSAFSGQPSAV